MTHSPSSTPKPPPFLRRPLAWLLAIVALAGLAWHLLPSRDLEALTLDDQRQLVAEAADWVRLEREVQRPFAEPLAPSELELLSPYFPREILENARVRTVAKMPKPRFLNKIRHQGKPVLNFQRALGLALDDTILLRGENIPAGSPARRSVLFHELVHLVQYETLGVDSFTENYLESMVAKGYSYRDIVFEHQAFELQNRFHRNPHQPFSVALEVEQMTAQFEPAN